jgi:Bacterial extracellular solute-binding protein, family 7
MADMVGKFAIKVVILLVGSLVISETGPAYARDVRLATAVPSDSFLLSLEGSLERNGIKSIVQSTAKDDDVLDAILNGSADAGLFTLGALARRKFDDKPRLFSALTRPFVFHSSDQIFKIEQSPLGDAILADIARAGIVPLDYWNRGLSQIIAKQPLISIENFRGLTIGSSSTDLLKENGTNSILISLGAKPRPSSDAIGDFRKGNLEAAVWEPLTYDGKYPPWNIENFEKVYATDFQPIVGIVASSKSYWEGLREADKLVWKQALREAEGMTFKKIKENDYVTQQAGRISVVALSREQIGEIASVIPDQQQYMLDYKLLDDAEAFIASTQVKKKPN